MPTAKKSPAKAAKPKASPKAKASTAKKAPAKAAKPAAKKTAGK